MLFRSQQYDYDLVLATGDLVQDNSDEGYLRFRQEVKALNNKMVFWIPGNHDFQPKMFEILKEDSILYIARIYRSYFIPMSTGDLLHHQRQRTLNSRRKTAICYPRDHAFFR